MPTEQLTHWFSLLTGNSPFLFAVLDTNHKYLSANNRYSEISGLEPAELKGKCDSEIFGQAFYDAMAPHYRAALAGNDVEGEISLIDGTHETSFHFHVTPFKNPASPHAIEGIIFHASDTSERQVLLTTLESAETKFDLLCQQIKDGCCLVENGVITDANKAAAGLLGHHHENEIVGKELANLVSCPQQPDSLLSALNRLKQNERLECILDNGGKALSLSQSPLELSSGTIALLTIEPGKAVKEERYQKLAHFDVLTGLYNRHGFSRRLEQLIKDETPLMMMYLDIDNFKNINDSLGHHIGDQVLKDIAQRLRRLLPAHTVLGHLGGDEFAVLLPGQNSDDSKPSLTDQIVSVISQPFELYHFNKYLACSIGMVKYPGDGKDARSLLQNADTAMYEAKEQGRNRAVAYNEHMNKEARMRLWLEIELQKALKNNGLEVWYQPKVSAKDYCINGAEALVRWKHPVEGYISPARFIPVAERSGMIEQLGRTVMREVFQAVHRWEQLDVLPGRVAINLSPQQFRNPKLTEHMKQLQQSAKIDPESITFELTESAVMNDSDHAIQMLNAIKDLGFALSIDDFGTGYSSLAYLARFPLDELKIDRAFICDMDNLPKQVTLIENIINLGRSLNMSVVAEGVETSKQAKVLTNLNCDTIQGFHFYRPMPKEEFEAILVKNQRLPAIAS